MKADPRRSYRALVAAQFLTVLNDSAYKQIVLLWSVDRMAAAGTSRDFQAEAAFVFGLPFVLCAAFFGDLADRWPKPRVVRRAKLLEIGVMALAALALQQQAFYLAWTALALMGAQSAMLGPAKYGLVPELVGPRELPAANSWLQLFVVAGILLGIGGAGFSQALPLERRWLFPAGFALLAAAGWILARGIHEVPAADPGRRLRFDPLGRLRDSWRLVRSRPGLGSAVLGHGLFWFAGALVTLAWNEIGHAFDRDGRIGLEAWTLRLAALTLSGAAGYLASIPVARRGWEEGLVPASAALTALLFLAAGLLPPAPDRLFLLLLAANFFAGLFVIPLKTRIQRLPDPRDLGRTLGASQLCDWVLILGASVVKWLLTAAGAAPEDSFLLLAAVLAAAALLLRQSLAAAPEAPSGPPPDHQPQS